MARLYFPTTGTRARLAHMDFSRATLGRVPPLYTLQRFDGTSRCPLDVVDCSEPEKYLDFPDRTCRDQWTGYDLNHFRHYWLIHIS